MMKVNYCKTTQKPRDNVVKLQETKLKKKHALTYTKYKDNKSKEKNQGL